MRFMHAAVLGRAAAGLADEAGRVRVVDHHHRAVFLGEIADRVELREVAVHREHAVGRDHAQPLALRLLQRLFERVHVAVRIAMALGLAEADAVDDRGVVERVGDDRVLLAEQRLEEAAVRVEARACRGSCPPCRRTSRSSCSSSLWMSCVPQMKRTLERPKPRVVDRRASRRRSPRDATTARGSCSRRSSGPRARARLVHARFDRRALRRRDDALLFEEPRFANFGERLLVDFLRGVEHGRGAYRGEGVRETVGIGAPNDLA